MWWWWCWCWGWWYWPCPWGGWQYIFSISPCILKYIHVHIPRSSWLLPFKERSLWNYMLKESTTRFQVFPGIYIYLKSTCMKTCLFIHVVCHPIHKAKQHVQVAAMRAGGHRKGMELASAPGSTFSYSFPLKNLFFLLVGKQQQKFDMFSSCKLLWDFHQFRI